MTEAEKPEPDEDERALRKRFFDYVHHAIRLWKTPDGQTYADCFHDGHWKTWPFEGPIIDAWLRERYVSMCHYKDIPPPNLVETVLKHLKSQTLLTKEIHVPHIRVARKENEFWYDLHNDAGTVVKVTHEGWEVVPKNGIKFTAGDGMLPQVTPMRGGSLELLRKYLSLETEDDWRLVVSWLIGAYVANDGYPILVLNGGAGSAKSSTTSILQRLVDPGKERREPPGDAKDIASIVKNTHLLTIDNLQRIEPWLSDTLCRVSTGGTLGARQYYTLHSDAGFEAIRPTILNGIPQFVNLNDLMERSVLLNLPTIDETKRLVWKEMSKEFETDRPLILGAIFDVIVKGLREEPLIRISKLPRLAGWAKFMEACKGTLGFSFLEVWDTQEIAKSAETIASNPFAQAIMSRLEKRVEAREDPVISGSVGHVWNEIKMYLNADAKELQYGAKGFSTVLKRLTPDLARQGIKVFTGIRTAKGRKYEIRLIGDLPDGRT